MLFINFLNEELSELPCYVPAWQHHKYICYVIDMLNNSDATIIMIYDLLRYIMIQDFNFITYAAVS